MTFDQIKAGLKAGTLTRSHALVYLDELDIRGDFDGNGEFMGYDYCDQCWINFTA